MMLLLSKLMKILSILLIFYDPSVCFTKVIHVDHVNGKNDVFCRFGRDPDRACKTFDYAFHDIERETEIIVSSGVQVLENTIKIDSVDNLSITGQPGSIVNCSTYGTGIMFDNVKNLNISGITFHNCGALWNISSPADYYGLPNISCRVALYIINSTNFKIMNAGFTANFGTGLRIKDTSGNVSISYVNFSNNSVPSFENHIHPGGGGLLIELTTHIIGSTYNIVHCTFRNNNAASLPNMQYTYMEKNGPVVDIFGCGGGLGASLQGIVSNNFISISHCKFERNNALFGGGMCLKVKGEAIKNTFHINNVTFFENKVSEGGGGIKFGIFDAMSLNQNSFIFNVCKFDSNKARFGGGVLYVSVRIPYSTEIQSLVMFNNTQWSENAASVGAAVALIPEEWDILSSGYLPVPRFHGCNFIGNSLWVFYATEAALEYSTEEILGGGILYSDMMSVNISGQSTFYDNRGSAIHISAGQINVLPDSTIAFIANIAHNGGGISLMGYSYLIAHKNSTILFKNNHALEKGGAIFFYSVDALDYLNSHSCFLRYSELIPVSDWKVNFTFSHNNANLYGHSIYATSLEACARFSISNVSGHVNLNDVFHWKSFSFTPPLDSPKHLHIITTDASKIKVTDMSYTSVPGIPQQLPVEIVDDLDQEVKAVLIGTLNTTHTNTSTYYIPDKKLVINGKENSSIDLTLATSGGVRPIGAKIVVDLIECPPGYYLTDSNACKCIANTKFSLPGILGCDDDSVQTFLREGYWAGCLNGTSGPLITAECPLGYCNYDHDMWSKNSDFLILPSNCTALDKSICGQGNRTGKICGDCIGDLSVHYHSYRYMCKECANAEYGIPLYILSELLPLTTFFIFTVVFDVALTSGTVNGFIFFAQTLDISEVSAYGAYTLNENFHKKFTRVYQFIFGFLNLDFFKVDELSFCLWEHATVLDVLAFKYFTILYGLFLICFLFLLMRFCHFGVLQRLRNSDRYTVTNGLTTFLIISYSQLVKVSFQILARIQLNSNTGRKLDVIFLSGNTPFFGSNHLKYALPAVIVSICTAIIPIVLISHSVYHSCRQLFISKRIINIQDSNNNHSSSTASNRCSLKLQLYSKPIIDSLQGCYKDHTRFFAGLMFLYRFVISATFALTASNLNTFASLECIIILILTIHSVFQPYSNRYHNLLDTLMFADLALINFITLYSTSTSYNVSQPDSYKELQTFLILIPMLYILCLLLVKLIIYCKARIRRSRSGMISEISTFDVDHLPDRMIQEDLLSKNRQKMQTPPLPQLVVTRSDSEDSDEQVDRSVQNKYGTF